MTTVDWSKIKISWLEIIREFSVKYDEVFLRRNAKAHFDYCDVVIDGAKERWRYLLLMDAVLSIVLQKMPSDHRSVRRQFEHHEVFRECAVNLFKRALHEYTTRGTVGSPNASAADSSFSHPGKMKKESSAIFGIDDIISAANIVENKNSFDSSGGDVVSSVPNSSGNNKSATTAIAATSLSHGSPSESTDDSYLALLSLRDPEQLAVRHSPESPGSETTAAVLTSSSITGGGGRAAKRSESKDTDSESKLRKSTSINDLEILMDVNPPWNDVVNWKNSVWKSDRVKKGFVKRKRMIDQICADPILQGPNALKRILNQTVMRVLLVSFPHIRPSSNHDAEYFAIVSRRTSKKDVKRGPDGSGDGGSGGEDISGVLVGSRLGRYESGGGDEDDYVDDHYEVVRDDDEEDEDEDEDNARMDDGPHPLPYYPSTAPLLTTIGGSISVPADEPSPTAGGANSGMSLLSSLFGAAVNAVTSVNQRTIINGPTAAISSASISTLLPSTTVSVAEAVSRSRPSKVFEEKSSTLDTSAKMAKILTADLTATRLDTVLQQQLSASTVSAGLGVDGAGDHNSSDGTGGDASIQETIAVPAQTLSLSIVQPTTAPASAAVASVDDRLQSSLSSSAVSTTTATAVSSDYRENRVQQSSATSSSSSSSSSGSFMAPTAASTATGGSSGSNRSARLAVSGEFDPRLSENESDSILRGVRLRPQHLPGDWCMPGCIVGYYVDGIARPSSSAMAFVVVLSRYSASSSSSTVHVSTADVIFDVAFSGLFSVRLDIELMLSLRDNGGKNEMLCWTPQGKFSFWDQYLLRTVNNPTPGTRILGIVIHNMTNFVDIGLTQPVVAVAGVAAAAAAVLPGTYTATVYLTPNGELTSVRHDIQMLRLQMQNFLSFFTTTLQQHEAVILEHELKHKDHDNLLKELAQHLYPTASAAASVNVVAAAVGRGSSNVVSATSPGSASMSSSIANTSLADLLPSVSGLNGNTYSGSSGGGGSLSRSSSSGHLSGLTRSLSSGHLSGMSTSSSQQQQQLQQQQSSTNVNASGNGSESLYLFTTGPSANLSDYKTSYVSNASGGGSSSGNGNSLMSTAAAAKALLAERATRPASQQPHIKRPRPSA